PAFASGFGDSAQIGAVIPSHQNDDGSLSQWAIWSGYLKSFKLNSSGQIPVITAVPLATATPTDTVPPTATPTPGGPTSTPAPPVPTSTPTPSALTYPDEETPNDASVMTRRPVWNAGRVLGYTDPQTQLTENQAPTPAKPGIKAPEIDVWPGRRLLWTTGAGGTAVPLTRRDLMPNTGTCAGGCFTALLGTMGLTIAPTDITLGTRTVEFLRG